MGSFVATSALATDFETYRIPDEYESTPGHGLALGNGGVAAVGGVTSLRVNPAMMAMEPHYTVAGGYHWPSKGREFFNVGVVDSKTSKIAAGASYTGFTEDHVWRPNDPGYNRLDSPVRRRGQLGIAQTFGLVSAGIAGHFVEAVTTDGLFQEESSLRGTSIGLGVAVLAMPQLRLGMSIEHLANSKVAEYAPRTYRAGAAYLLFGGDVSAHLDYVNRARVDRYEAPIVTSTLFGVAKTAAADQAPTTDTEQSMIGSFSARVFDMFRILGAYTHGLNNERRAMAGGLALINESFSLTYAANQPYLDLPESHQAVSLSAQISL